MFAVPPPRPVRGVSSEVPETISVSPQGAAAAHAASQHIVVQQAAIRAAAVAAVSERPLQVSDLASLRGHNIPFDALPGNQAALATAAALR